MKLLTLAAVASLSGTLALCGGAAAPARPSAPTQASATAPAADAQTLIDVRGRVVDVRRSVSGGDAVAAVVRVEGRKEPDTRYDAALVRVTTYTRIVLKSTNQLVSIDDLRTGAIVEVRLIGPIAKSYPLQAAAEEIVVLDAAPEAGANAGGASASDEQTAENAAFVGTTKVTERSSKGGGTAVLRAVRTARQNGFDRTVFEFEGDKVPAYRVEYAGAPVVQCGSGKRVSVRGRGRLRVQFTGAAAHTEAGKATVGFRERATKLPNLLEIESVCDFEGEVSWVLGVRASNAYRATELANPARLVVDVKH